MQIDATASHDQTTAIRTLNDHLRQTGQGGMTLVSHGMAAQEPDDARTIYAAVREFDRFDQDNDPHGEHDCAVMEVLGLKIIWKIDYYDRSRRSLSPNPADPKVTIRVLTIMLAEEY